MTRFPTNEPRPDITVESLLFHARDRERKRIARELHESAGQLLAVLRLNLARAKRTLSPDLKSLLDEADDTIDQLSKEVRTFPFLGHPPELKDHRLRDALELLVDGHEARTGIDLERTLILSERLAPPIEACIYRIVQETLLNVHRQTGASKVTVCVFAADRSVHVRINDNGDNGGSGAIGHGDHGVGLASMTERAEELGGTLAICRGTSGTTLLASLPLDQR